MRRKENQTKSWNSDDWLIRFKPLISSFICEIDWFHLPPKVRVSALDHAKEDNRGGKAVWLWLTQWGIDKRGWMDGWMAGGLRKYHEALVPNQSFNQSINGTNMEEGGSPPRMYHTQVHSSGLLFSMTHRCLLIRKWLSKFPLRAAVNGMEDTWLLWKGRIRGTTPARGRYLVHHQGSRFIWPCTQILSKQF